MHRRRQMHQTCPGAQWYPVFEGECDMRVPQVSERIKEAPAQALRGVFAGIGQLLLITDKLKNKAPHQEMRRARIPVAPGTVTDTAVTSPPGQAAAAAPAGSATETTPAAAAPAAPAPAPAETVAAKPAAAEPAAARPATARRPAAKPAAGKPVTPKPGAKPVTAKPPTARRPAAKAAPAELAGQPPPKPPKQQSTRDFDKTGNVRLLGGDKDSPVSGAGGARHARAGTRRDRARRRCPTTTSCRWRRCAPGCVTSTSRGSGSSRSTSGRTPPGPTC